VSTMRFARRIERLMQALAEKGLEGAVIFGASNVFYFTGTNAASAFVVGPQGAVLVTYRLEILRALEEKKVDAAVLGYVKAENLETAEWEDVVEGGLEDAVLEAMKRVGLKVEKAGSNAETLQHSAFESLTKKIGKTESIADLISKMRAIKDDEEIRAMEKAARVAERALEAAIDSLREGVSEGEVAGEILRVIHSLGAEPSFPPIVAFGPHSAQPHAKPGIRKLAKGDIVKLDLGARLDGYCSDITRTLIYSGASEEQKKILKVVAEAQEKAIEAVEAGTPCKDVDAVARKVISEAGYAAYFNHGLGHGVGVDVHEKPYLGPTSKDTLEKGMVFTIEPGVYIKGLGGVRIEDMVFLSDKGPVTLTKFDRLL